MSIDITAPPADALRDEALAAVADDRPADAYDAQRRALAARVDLEWLNDLAVIAHRLGRPDEAAGVLRAVLAIDPSRDDARENLAALGADGPPPSAAPTVPPAAAPPTTAGAAWRAAPAIGGPDPQMFERAFPGMPRPDVMSEHCSRYAFALGVVGARHVLDLGCGTGYGSEMLSWAAASVRGFDLWRPNEDQRPRWPGVASLTYGHDLCVDPLPAADVAVMFEVIEHLPDAPAALRIAWSAVDTIVASFPNPVHHGSWMNPFHVTDWTLDEFERELVGAANRFASVELAHFHQPVGSPLLAAGRDPAASFWVVVARGQRP